MTKIERIEIQINNITAKILQLVLAESTSSSLITDPPARIQPKTSGRAVYDVTKMKEAVRLTYKDLTADVTITIEIPLFSDINYLHANIIFYSSSEKYEIISDEKCEIGTRTFRTVLVPTVPETEKLL